MSVRTDRIDGAVLGLIGAEPVAIADLTHGGNRNTVRNSIKRLFERGVLDRQWDGNERFGRYLYWRKQE
jgi:hypothetical protein